MTYICIREQTTETMQIRQTDTPRGYVKEGRGDKRQSENERLLGDA